jgi:hypothetical protein
VSARYWGKDRDEDVEHRASSERIAKQGNCNITRCKPLRHNARANDGGEEQRGRRDTSTN